MRILLILCLLFTACSKQEPAKVPEAQATTPPPTVAEARELIARSAELGEFEFTNAAVSLPVAASMRNAPAQDLVKELRESGWLGVDGGGQLVLTTKSREDRRFLMRPNGILDIVPLAKKEIGDVEDVRMNADGTAVARFTWRWLPNEVGGSIGSGPVQERFAGEQRSTATLIWDGTAWSVLKIER